MGVAAAPGSLPRPAPRGAPEAFVCTYLPSLAAALFESWPLLATPLEVELVIEGTAFVVSLSRSGVSGNIGQAPAPLGRASLTLAAWRALSADVLPRLLKHWESEPERARASMRRLTTLTQELSRGQTRLTRGRVNITYTDDAGDVLELHLEIGGGQGPLALLELGDAELWRLLRGGGTFASVLPKMRVHGDASYLLRLAAELGGVG